MALYNKMRPRYFEEVLGQEMVTENLKNAIMSGNIPHSMLLTGERGTGKTTVAKIVARLLNCANPIEGRPCGICQSCVESLNGVSSDILELDAASHNGVEDVRQIIESARYQPVGNYKVYILDEVHMLSNGAFNALLKIMEEPPATVVFILCTTEVHKVPSTIMSRCARFNFKTLPEELIMQKLATAGAACEENALRIIARAAKGSMRDAESIFEPFYDSSLATGKPVTEEIVLKGLGIPQDEAVVSVITSIVEGNARSAYETIDRVYEDGYSLKALLERCIDGILDIINIQMGMNLPESRSNHYKEEMHSLAARKNPAFFIEASGTFKDALASMKGSGDAPVIMKTCILDAMNKSGIIAELEKRVKALEDAFLMGITPSERKPAVTESAFIPVPDELADQIPFSENGGNEKKSPSIVTGSIQAPAGTIPLPQPVIPQPVLLKPNPASESVPIMAKPVLQNPAVPVQMPVSQPAVQVNAAVEPMKPVTPIPFQNGQVSPVKPAGPQPAVPKPQILQPVTASPAAIAPPRPVTIMPQVQPAVIQPAPVPVIPSVPLKKEPEEQQSDTGKHEGIFAPFARTVMSQDEVDQLKSMGFGTEGVLTREEEPLKEKKVSEKKRGPLDLSAFRKLL